jgi:hypothetical protein
VTEPDLVVTVVRVFFPGEVVFVTFWLPTFQETDLEVLPLAPVLMVVFMAMHVLPVCTYGQSMDDFDLMRNIQGYLWGV